MIDIQITDYSVIIAFWLVFTRVSTIVLLYPIFDNAVIPNVLKVLVSLFISYIFFPFVQVEVLKDIQYIGVENFWILTMFNVIVGLVIGFLVQVLMNLYVGAGGLISQQVGFAALTYFDPSAGSQVGPFEKLMQWTMVILILSSGALIPMFKGCFESFANIHIYDYSALQGITDFYLEMFNSIFLSSIMLASPLIFTNLIITAIMGVVARTVPQMNVLMVSFVINIGVGLLVFLSINLEFFSVGYKMYVELLGKWFQFIS